MPDPWTAAWEEANASLPPGVMFWCTLELLHPTFIDEGDPFSIRIANTTEEVNLELEDEAPLNPGENVTFQPVAFEAEMPEFAEGITPSTQITIDNVARTLMPHLETAVLSRADFTLIYREYRTDDSTGPCYGPVTFVLKKVNVTGTKVTGVAKIDDLANKKFPNKVYTFSQFPGLQRG